ncbi:putative arabinose 5-phosphate isomerase [Acetobacteraceae bacterium AT-5844]|nr:putative arabinose 5-phosphate isomerase [Acetobacteraceae bacterium AT-5844]
MELAEIPVETRTALDAARETIELETRGLAALRAALDGELGVAFERAVEAIQKVQAQNGRLIVTGMGKSGHVGRKIAASLASTGTPAYFVHPGEASHGDLGMIRDEDAVLALSWSGEAPELSDICSYCTRFSIPLLAITSREESALGRAATHPLVLPRQPEACPNGLAPTTSTTMQLAMGDALAVALLSLKGFSAQDFRRFHPGGKLGAKLRKARDLMHPAAEVPLVRVDAKLSDAIMEMTSKRFGVTGVVDDAGLLVGVITDGDLRRSFADRFADKPVAEMMTRTPRSVAPDMMATEVLAELNDAGITTLFVVEGRRPVGILHVHDLLRAGVV